MTDPVASVGVATEIAAQQTPPVQTPPPSLDAGETRMFANMMQNLPPVPTAVSPPSAFRDAAMAVAVKLGGQERSFEDLRRGMLEAVDLRDPVKTMLAMTDHSMQAHALFAKLHIASGLAGATTSLFGGLLKNQG